MRNVAFFTRTVLGWLVTRDTFGNGCMTSPNLLAKSTAPARLHLLGWQLSMSAGAVVAFGMVGISVAAVGAYVARRRNRTEMQERAADTNAAFATLGLAGKQAASAAVSAATPDVVIVMPQAQPADAMKAGEASQAAGAGETSQAEAVVSEAYLGDIG